VRHCPSCASSFFCLECDTVLHRAVKIRGHVRHDTRPPTLEPDGGALPPALPPGPQEGGKGHGRGLSGGHLEIDRHEIKIQAKLGEGYFGVVFR
jgi:hypothetical protein